MDLALELQTLIYHNLDYFTLRSLVQLLPCNRALYQRLAQVCYIDDTTFMEGCCWIGDRFIKDIDASIVIIDMQKSEENNVVLYFSEHVRELIIKDFGTMVWCEIKFHSPLERLTLIRQSLVRPLLCRNSKTHKYDSLFKCYDGISLPYLPIAHMVLDNCSIMMSSGMGEYFTQALSCAKQVTISKLGWATCEEDEFYLETRKRFYTKVVPHLLEVFPDMTYRAKVE